jgi:hypothetical protein
MNAQRLENNYSSRTCMSSENICSNSGALWQKERQDEIEKLVWVTFISFWKICTPNYAFDALLCRN